ncbi:MAG: hypothetical protein KAI24_12200 [Planctomycetes bacterium]|nr:hypothetical protein [Planctomycetota bacterium]
MTGGRDPADTRLGQLQRGRGAGFVRALADGAAARDDVLRCVLEDPRVDRQIEARGRYLGELFAALRLPVAPVAEALRDADGGRLGHEVLAVAFACGHRGARRLLDDPLVDVAVREEVALCLVDADLLTPLELPAPLRRFVMDELLLDADSADVLPRLRRGPDQEVAGLSVDELLEQARTARPGRGDVLHDELVRRRTAADLDRLWGCLRDDRVHGRVRAAARALGAIGDQRALSLCEDLFAREDVFEDPARRLPAELRMRRAALSSYVRALPAARQLALARSWHPRGGHFAVVGGFLFEQHAEPDDRDYLERHVARDLEHGTGWNMISELDALARLADPRSMPLLVAVCEAVAYSHARRRAVHGLALLASETGASPGVLREALWDCEDEAAADACTFGGPLDGAAGSRVKEMSRSPIFDAELRERAARRLRRRP